MAEDATRRIEKAAAYGDVPRGACFRFWQVGSCSLRSSCKYQHIANPRPAGAGQAEAADSLMSCSANRKVRDMKSREGGQGAAKDWNDAGQAGNIPKGACFRFFSSNACEFGKNCKYSHDMNEFAATSRPAEAFPEDLELARQHAKGGSFLQSSAQTLDSGEAPREEDRKEGRNHGAACAGEEVSGLSTRRVEEVSQGARTAFERTITMLEGFTARCSSERTPTSPMQQTTIFFQFANENALSPP